ncbi:TPM domain-containing protein [Pseudomonas sp. LP_7_YM]|uniref:TPM domain-containing protein n=1 Tax=Pseudomonas sp. LP_7_YM TaxID=2485137 RepID=UPI00105D85E2|nr:TPM domain-containing protein [Pseudomonas sp. LP_7_YM]TDV70068.1 putative membrane protein [Pseudomonas sp. LP_7_YM]
MALLTEDEQQQVTRAIEAVERGTDAELVTVLAASADDYAYAPLIWAGLVALLLPGLINFHPGWLNANELLLTQIATFIVVALVCRLPAIGIRLVPASVRHWRAGSLARRQFLEQNLHSTLNGTGVLIFVSEAERYVEIIVDDGIARRVDDSVWRSMVDVFTLQVRQGRILEGFLGCIHSCGQVLSEQIPVTQPRNELPNRLVVLE